VAPRGGATTRHIETSGAGPRPKAARPYTGRKRSAKKQEITTLQCRRSSLLPDQSLQPPPEGAHAPPADLLVAPPVTNAENFCSTRFHPHLGHSGRSWLRVNTSFFEDMSAVGTCVFKYEHGPLPHALALTSQLSSFELPAGNTGRVTSPAPSSLPPGHRHHGSSSSARKV